VEPVTINTTLAELQGVLVHVMFGVLLLGFFLGVILQDVVAFLGWRLFYWIANWARRRKGLEPLVYCPECRGFVGGECGYYPGAWGLESGLSAGRAAGQAGTENLSQIQGIPKG
jgi:hypothetical protein